MPDRPVRGQWNEARNSEKTLFPIETKFPTKSEHFTYVLNEVLITSQYKSGTRSCSRIFENRNGKFRSDRPIYNSNEISELGLEI